MKRPLSLLCLIILLVLASNIEAQKRSVSRKLKTRTSTAKTNTNKAIVIDERLAVLRISPSLYASAVQRVRRGGEVFISETRVADGVTFYRVNISPTKAGWMQADAVAGTFRRGDDQRLARLIQASDDYDRIERASIFIEYFPKSTLRPPILLLFGDLIEEEALQLSRRATRSFDRVEMAASGAPLHSFYLNFSYLDRYRKLGVVFLFNARTKQYHYDGATWKELIKNYPNSDEAKEAEKRLESLGEKLER